MNIKKFISLLTTFCFLVSFAGQNLAWAAPEPSSGKIGSEEFKKIFENIPQIPVKYGKVTFVSNLGSKSIAVNIQDLHCHPEAQKNINNIIEILDKNYKVRSVYVEGAYDKVDIEWLSGIQDKALRDSFAEQMLNDGKLNASEYYAVKNDKKDFLLGIENKARHEENIKRLAYILEKQEEYGEILSRVQANLQYWDAKYTNIRNKRFNRMLEKYHSGNINTDKFYAILNKYVNKVNANPQKYNNALPINMSHYPNIQNFMFATKANAKLDMKKVQIQLQYVLAYLKGKLPPPAFQMFLDETDNFSNVDRLAAALSNFSTMFNIDLGINYGELNTFFKLQTLSRAINPLDIIAEERHLIERLRTALSYDQTENEIAFMNDFYGYFKDYMQNKLMADDFAYFSSHSGKFRELYAKYAIVNDLKRIESDFSILNAYHSLNDERNDIFAENIFKYWTPDAGKTEDMISNDADTILKNAEEIIIVVTGGYHSHGLKDILAKKGITNIIITPTVTTDIKRAEEIYEEIIRRQGIFLREALSFTIASQAASQEQFEILVAAAISLLQNTRYSPDNIQALESMLKSVNSNFSIGTDGTITVPVSSGQIRKNTVKLTNKNGQIALDLRQYNRSVRGKQSYRSVIESVMNELVIPHIIQSNHGRTVFTPDVTNFVTGFVKFAEKHKFHNVLNANGLIPEADAFKREAESLGTAAENIRINGISLNTFGKLPALLQEAFLNAQKKEQENIKKPEAEIQTPEQRQGKKPTGMSRARTAFLRIAASILLFISISLPVNPQTDIVYSDGANIAQIEQTSPAAQESAKAVSGSTLIRLTDQQTRDAVRVHGMLHDYSDINDIRNSVKLSNSDDVQRLVNIAYDRLEAKGISYHSRAPILLLTSYGNESQGFASLNYGLIIAPSQTFDSMTEEKKINYIILKIAHEAVHIKNKDAVASGKMTRLEDEREAFEATIAGLIIAEPENIEGIKNQQHVFEAFDFIVKNRGQILLPIRSYEGKNVNFADLYYLDIQLDGTAVVTELFNEKTGNPYSYYFYFETDEKTVNLVEVIENLSSGEQKTAGMYEYRDGKLIPLVKTDNSQLELQETAAEADAKGLTGIKRAFFVAGKEFERSLLPGFVDMHYGEKGPTEADKISDAYKMRVKGDKIIKAVTKITQSICFGHITKLVKAANITTHAIYNILNPDAKLSLSDSINNVKKRMTGSGYSIFNKLGIEITAANEKYIEAFTDNFFKGILKVAGHDEYFGDKNLFMPNNTNTGYVFNKDFVLTQKDINAFKNIVEQSLSETKKYENDDLINKVLNKLSSQKVSSIIRNALPGDKSSEIINKLKQLKSSNITILSGSYISNVTNDVNAEAVTLKRDGAYGIFITKSAMDKIKNANEETIVSFLASLIAHEAVHLTNPNSMMEAPDEAIAYRIHYSMLKGLGLTGSYVNEIKKDLVYYLTRSGMKDDAIVKIIKRIDSYDKINAILSDENEDIISLASTDKIGNLKLAFEIAGKEFFQSLDSRFSSRHPTIGGKRGAAIVTASFYIPAIAVGLLVSLFNPLSIPIVAAGIIAGAIAGTISDLAVHTAIDYNYFNAVAAAEEEGDISAILEQSNPYSRINQFRVNKDKYGIHNHLFEKEYKKYLYLFTNKIVNNISDNDNEAARRIHVSADITGRRGQLIEDAIIKSETDGADYLMVHKVSDPNSGNFKELFKQRIKVVYVDGEWETDSRYLDFIAGDANALDGLSDIANKIIVIPAIFNQFDANDEADLNKAAAIIKRQHDRIKEAEDAIINAILPQTADDADEAGIRMELGVSEIVRVDVSKVAKDIAYLADAAKKGRTDATAVNSSIREIANAVAGGKGIALYFGDTARTDKGFYYLGVSNYMAELANVLMSEMFPGGRKISAEELALYRMLLEMIKNAYVHGNHLDGNRPVYLSVNKESREVKVLNKKHEVSHDDFANDVMNLDYSYYSKVGGLHGIGLGQKKESIEKLHPYLNDSTGNTSYRHSDPNADLYAEQFTVNDSYFEKHAESISETERRKTPDAADALAEKINAGRAGIDRIDFSEYFSKEAKFDDKNKDITIDEAVKATLRGKDFKNKVIQLSFNNQNHEVDNSSIGTAGLLLSFFANHLSQSLQNNSYHQLFETLKNAFVHGNNVDLSKDIYIYVSENGNEIFVINQKNPQTASLEKLAAAMDRNLFGAGIGVSNTIEAGDYQHAEINLAGTDLFVGSFLTTRAAQDNRSKLLNAAWSKEQLPRKHYPVYLIKDITPGEEMSSIIWVGDTQIPFKIVNENGRLSLKELDARLEIKEENGKFSLMSKELNEQIGELEIKEENGKFYLISQRENIDLYDISKSPSDPVAAALTERVETQIVNIDLSAGDITLGEKTLRDSDFESAGFLSAQLAKIDINTLNPEQRSTLAMLENAKKLFGADKGQVNVQESEKALDEVIAHLKTYMSAMIKNRTSLNIESADTFLFLNGLDVLFAYFSNINMPAKNFKSLFADVHEFDYVWKEAFYDLAKNSKENLSLQDYLNLQDFIYLDLMKSFTQTTEEYMDDFAVKVSETLIDKIKSIDASYDEKTNIPQNMADNIRNFFFSTYDFVPGFKTQIGALEKLINSGEIKNQSLLGILRSITSDSMDSKKKNAATNIDSYIEAKIKLIENIPNIGTPESVGYQFLLQKTDNDIADAIRFMEENGEKMSAKQQEELNKAFPNDTAKYLSIIAGRDNKTFLLEIFNSKEEDLTMRLLALLYLKAANNQIDNTAEITKEFSDKMISAQAKNDYEVKAMMMGTHLLLMTGLTIPESVETTQIKGHYGNLFEIMTYGAIVKPAIRKDNEVPSNANSYLLFTQGYASVNEFAHEIGHNYLHIIAPQLLTDTQAVKTLHEFFAFAIQGFTNSLIGKILPYKDEYLSLHLFSDGQKTMRIHDASRGFINVLQNAVEAAGSEFMWIHLISAISKFAQGIASSQDYKSQKTLFEKFANDFANYMSDNFKNFDKEVFFESIKNYSADKHDLYLINRQRLLRNKPSTDNAQNYARDLTENDSNIADNYDLYSENKLKEVFTDAELGYIKNVMRYRSNFDVLANIANNKNADIMHRLFALNLFKASPAADTERFDGLIDEFIEKLENGEISITNDYDLRAVLAGINAYALRNIPTSNDEIARFHMRAAYSSVGSATFINKGIMQAPSGYIYLTDISKDNIISALENVNMYFRVRVDNFHDNLLKTLNELRLAAIRFNPQTAALSQSADIGKTQESGQEQALSGSDIIANALAEKLNAGVIELDFSRLFSDEAKKIIKENNNSLPPTLVIDETSKLRNDLKGNTIIRLSLNDMDMSDDFSVKTVTEILRQAALDISRNGLFKDAGFELDMQIADILRNAFVHGNGIDLSKDIYIYISEDGNEIFVINQESAQAPSLEKLAAATDARMFGAGMGIGVVDDYKFAKINLAGRNLFIGSFLALSKFKEDKRAALLESIDGNAKWSDAKLERTNYPVYALPDIKPGEEMSVVSGSFSLGMVNFKIENKDGKLSAVRPDSEKIFPDSNDRDKRQRLNEMLPVLNIIKAGNGKFYLVSPLIVINFGDISKSPIKAADDPEKTDALGKTGDEDTAKKYKSFADNSKNYHKMTYDDMDAAYQNSGYVFRGAYFDPADQNFAQDISAVLDKGFEPRGWGGTVMYTEDLLYASKFARDTPDRENKEMLLFVFENTPGLFTPGLEDKVLLAAEAVKPYKIFRIEITDKYNTSFTEVILNPAMARTNIPQGSVDLINKALQSNLGPKLIEALTLSAAIPKTLSNEIASVFGNAGAKHIIVNYHFIRRSAIADAVREFGSAAVLTAEGYVNLPVYVINDMGAEDARRSELNFEPTGVSINGNALWVSKSQDAVIIYCEGASYQSIAQELSSNRKINSLVKRNAGTSVLTNLNNISVEWMEVDHSAGQKDITYSENGNVRVGYDLFKAMLGDTVNFNASLRRIKNIDGFTLAQGLLHRLDDIVDVDDFTKYFDQHKKIGNGQIVISQNLAEKIGIQKLSVFLNEARKAGVEIYLDTEKAEMPVKFKDAGFSGYVYPKASGFEMYNYALGTTSELSTLENFDPNLSLEENIKKAGAMVVLNNSELRKKLDERRSGLEILGIIEIISSIKILKIFPEKITPEFALRAARNFEVSDMPVMSSEKAIAAMKEFYENENKDDAFTALVSSLNLQQSHPVSVYILKLKSQMTDDIETTSNAFVKGITEKILAANALRDANKLNDKLYGLQDRTLEIILGRVLVSQILENTKGEGVSAKNEHRVKDGTMREAEKQLYEIIQLLRPIAFEDEEISQQLTDTEMKAKSKEKAQAINSLAELIPAFAEERRKNLTKDDIKPEFNMKDFESILTAA
ncbi:MAG: hypothetical protein FWH43_01185 [Endomicrobia bacterium]|nr:hypothetical protein [Endomicrobiia bacterium]